MNETNCTHAFFVSSMHDPYNALALPLTLAAASVNGSKSWLEAEDDKQTVLGDETLGSTPEWLPGLGSLQRLQAWPIGLVAFSALVLYLLRNILHVDADASNDLSRFASWLVFLSGLCNPVYLCTGWLLLHGSTQALFHVDSIPLRKPSRCARRIPFALLLFPAYGIIGAAVACSAVPLHLAGKPLYFTALLAGLLAGGSGGAVLGLLATQRLPSAVAHMTLMCVAFIAGAVVSGLGNAVAVLQVPDFNKIDLINSIVYAFAPVPCGAFAFLLGAHVLSLFYRTHEIRRTPIRQHNFILAHRGSKRLAQHFDLFLSLLHLNVITTVIWFVWSPDLQDGDGFGNPFFVRGCTNCFLLIFLVVCLDVQVARLSREQSLLAFTVLQRASELEHLEEGVLPIGFYIYVQEVARANFEGLSVFGFSLTSQSLLRAAYLVVAMIYALSKVVWWH
eukprot:TRINITY_DN28588_c0_g1_i1.p1 TRINITY_DN28588_c0_g1~~TRINITY_DN28588_c0_g1_i1.p1  ORF type:complete len:448 (+),score=42.25 TRINITY_DN28588_c0_g1_i1:359-1702(+)